MSYLKLEAIPWGEDVPVVHRVYASILPNICIIGWEFNTREGKVVHHIIHDHPGIYMEFEDAVLEAQDILLKKIRRNGLYSD